MLINIRESHCEIEASLLWIYYMKTHFLLWFCYISIDEVKEASSGKVFKSLNIPCYYVGVLDKILDTHL